MLTLQNNESSDVSPVFPYIETDEELIERQTSLDKRKAALDPVALEDRLRKAREAHLAKHGAMRGR